MPDKYDAMPDGELAAKMLAMMGYEQLCENAPTWWEREDAEDGWYLEDTIHAPDKHAFAAEVKGWMRADVDKNGVGWSCEDAWVFYTDPDKDGSVDFQRGDMLGTAFYSGMAAHPRAVCIAALRAKAAEKEAACPVP